MLAIRMQRTGRHGHAMFRMIVQDSRRTPTSGNIVALLGNYDPHTKTAVFDKEKASYYLEHGAQPSDRVIFLMKAQGLKLPSWVSIDNKKTTAIRNQAKLRRNRPASEAAPAPKVANEITPEVEAETTATPSPDEEVADNTTTADSGPNPAAASEPVVEEVPASEEPPTVEPKVTEPQVVAATPEAIPSAKESLEK
jgi:small subunit ribosomal protein S16